MNTLGCCTKCWRVEHQLQNIMALHFTLEPTVSIHAGQRPAASGNGLKSDKNRLSVGAITPQSSDEFSINVIGGRPEPM
jgi:hypothetical protein